MSTIQNTDDRDTVHPEDGPLKVAIAIVAHKDRAKQVDRLVDWVDPDYVSWDDGTLGPAENHLRAWENLAEEDAEVCLVLEDDAVPVANFRSELSRVLAVAPTDLVSLYLGKGRPPHWQPTLAKVFGSLDRRLYPNAPDPSWLIADEVLHGVALAMKPSLIADMLPVVRRSTQPRRRHRLPVDEAIGAWARSAGIRVSYSLPSIVQHGDLPTLITEHTTGHILTIPVIKPKVVAQLRDRVYAALSTTTFDQGKVALYLRDGDVNLHFDNGLYVALSAADFDRIVAAVAQAHEEMSA